VLGGLVEGEAKLELIDILVYPVPAFPLGALEGLLDVAGCAECDVERLPAFLLFDVFFLVEPDDVVVVPVPLECLVGSELLLEVRRVLPNHLIKLLPSIIKAAKQQPEAPYIMAVL
jgi:hypothetical protein